MSDWEAVWRRFRERMRQEGYQYRTEKTYGGWIQRFIRFCDGQSPEEVGSISARRYLTSLALDERVAAATQKQALNAMKRCDEVEETRLAFYECLESPTTLGLQSNSRSCQMIGCTTEDS